MNPRRPQHSIFFRWAVRLMLYAILSLFGLTIFAGVSSILGGQGIVLWLEDWLFFGIWRVSVVILCLLASGVIAESIG